MQSVWFDDDTTMPKMEASALRNGLILAQGKGIKRIYLEGDTSIVINSISKSQSCPQKIYSILSDCKNIILECNIEVRINHVYREGNPAADFLANLGHIIKANQIWDSNFPREILGIPWEDAIGRSSPRCC